MKVLFIAVVAFLQLTGSFGFDPNCPFPSSLWCSSYEIASACQVTEQCARTEWSPLQSAAPLVNFTLYYESRCPDCEVFIKEQLYPAYKSIWGIFNLTLVPYGNAREKKVTRGWLFECQHGEQECIGNIIDTCAINIVNNMTLTFPLIHCMESSKDRHARKAFDECVSKFPSIPSEKVENCSRTLQGDVWEHEMALKTDALNPPHQYVPWVTLNGVHNDQIQNKAEDNLIGLLCDTYTGTKPPGCQKKHKTSRSFN